MGTGCKSISYEFYAIWTQKKIVWAVAYHGAARYSVFTEAMNQGVKDEKRNETRAQ